MLCMWRVGYPYRYTLYALRYTKMALSKKCTICTICSRLALISRSFGNKLINDV